MNEDWKQYRKKVTQEMRDYVPGEDISHVSVSPEDTPREGGKIARNSKNHKDQWYINPEFVAENYELVEEKG